MISIPGPSRGDFFGCIGLWVYREIVYEDLMAVWEVLKRYGGSR